MEIRAFTEVVLQTGQEDSRFFSLFMSKFNFLHSKYNPDVGRAQDPPREVK